ncbi:DUF58 domain-containing protein [Alienimonas chondri]|uniref:DUF58 domain-containing protein n=1 Tax=Alienimonas chondri TaxID=2681879 RepID=A0ABX1V8Y5_9PLAN|nr:DUF58 domain-containing protein [Alienimonas chondri]NNJ24580.1 hypothetical protein [Alienimonas chondri]
MTAAPALPAADPVTTDPDVLAVAARYTLSGPPPRAGGAVGERVGRTAGSGLEFREHRRYLPGDDVRHLDWAAFARTDVPIVQVFREEVARDTAVWLDGSASMGCDPEKSRLARSLAAACWRMAAASGDRPTLHLLSETNRPDPRGRSLDSLDGPVFSGRGSLVELAAQHGLPATGRGVRVIVSDFLFPHDPDALVRRLARGTDAATLIQILSSFEADPPELGGRRLTDPEADEAAEVTLDRPAVAAYRARLRALIDGLARACRSHGATFATLVAGPNLNELCRSTLVPAGALGVRR